MSRNIDYDDFMLSLHNLCKQYHYIIEIWFTVTVYLENSGIKKKQGETGSRTTYILKRF